MDVGGTRLEGMADRRGSDTGRTKDVQGLVVVGVVTSFVGLSVAGSLGFYPWDRVPGALLGVALVLAVVGIIRERRFPGSEPSSLFGLAMSLCVGAALALPLVGTAGFWPAVWSVFAVALLTSAIGSGLLTFRAKRNPRGSAEGKRGK